MGVWPHACEFSMPLQRASEGSELGSGHVHVDRHWRGFMRTGARSGRYVLIGKNVGSGRREA